MPFEKIQDLTEKCLHPEHNPPQHISLQPGIYKYTCPSCGAAKTITVPRIIT